MVRTCGDCRFFHLAEGSCRRNPPVPLAIGSGLFGAFPPTTSDSWCGQWTSYRELEATVDASPAPPPPPAEPKINAYDLRNRGLSVDQARQEAKAAGFTGEICDRCQSTRMVRTGKCSTCQDCFATSGCS